MTTPQILEQRMTSSVEFSTTPGLRAAEAFVRPSPIATHGNVLKYEFDLRNCIFTFSLEAHSVTPETHPTEMFLPDWHFPPGQTNVEVSGGKWRIDFVDVDGEGMQMMKWWHGEGEQSMTIKGLKRKLGVIDQNGEDEVGYLESFWKLAANCTIM